MSDAVERAKAIITDEFAPHGPKSLLRDLVAEVERLGLAAIQLNEVAAKYQTKAEGAEQWAAERDRYKAALQWCHDNYPVIRDANDVHFGGRTIAELLAEAVRG